MAELLKKKLSFPSKFVKLQAAGQLIYGVQSKLENGINCSSELEILWKCCSEPTSEDLGYTCANALIQFAENGKLKFDKVIATAINHATAARNARMLLYIIGSLIKCQAVNHYKENPNVPFISPYDFREHPHPFISIVSSAASTKGLVDSEVACLILNCENSLLPVLLAALRPAILFVSLRGSNNLGRGTEFGQPVPALLNALLTKYSEIPDSGNGVRHAIKRLLYHIFDYYEPNTDNIKYFEDFASSDNGMTFCTHFILKLQCRLMKSSSLHDAYIFVRTISRMLQCCLPDGFDHDVIIVGFAFVLSNAPMQIISHVLSTVLSFLKCCSAKVLPVHCLMLKVALLKLKFLSSAVACCKEVERLLENLFQVITNALESGKDRNVGVTEAIVPEPSSNCFVAEVNRARYIMCRVTVSRQFRLSWLDGTNESVANKKMEVKDVDESAFILSTLFLHSLFDPTNYGDLDLRKMLQSLRRIGESYSEYSFKLLPILLYSLKSTAATATVEVLLSLPYLASHPNCVAPILNIIKGIGMSSDVNLKGISIRMMIELWKVQDRCFPYLLNALYSSEVQTIKKYSNHNVKVVKAAAVAFVCKERPHQHGADMLKLIEIMLNKNPSNEVLAYILEGLHSLCLNKVLKLITVTGRLINILQSNTDLMVTKGVLKILSLMSCCDTTEADFESNNDAVLIPIWELVCSGKPALVDEALYCLSHFNPSIFQIKHLPSVLWPTRSDDVPHNEFIETIIPYSQHLAIARNVDCIGMPGCTKFLTAVLNKELEDLPRGIHHKAMKSQLAATQPKAAKSIPNFVSNAYERNKKPALKAPLAFSMLLSQSSTNESDIQNTAAKKMAITAGRKSMDNIQAMLKEVTVEPNNWQDLIRCSQGWVSFMKKCVTTMTIGRRAETEIQKFDDPEEKDHRINTALLWCRDKIVNTLKAASKNGPSMQGNAVLGLTGLLVATEQFNDDEQRVAEDTEYVSMAHWALMVLDTIISIAYPSHVPSGRLLSWCQYRAISSTGKLCTTQVGRICAIHALPFCLASSKLGRHRKVRDILTLLGDDSINDKQLNFHRQISLGNALSILTKEQSQSNSSIAVSEFSIETCYQSMLEKVEGFTSCSSNLQDDIGSLIGWGLAATLRFSQSSHDCEREKLIWNYFLDILKTSDIAPDTLQTISVMMTWLCIHGCVRGILSPVDCGEMLNILEQSVEDVPTKSGFSDSLGTLCCGMLLNGNKSVASTMDKLFTQWFGIVEKGNSPTREKLAALVGLSSLCGASASLFSLPVDPAMLTATQYVSKLSGTVKLLKHLHTSSDVGMQSRSPVYLGSLNMFFENNIHNSSFILPSTYEYLSKQSILNGMFRTLMDNLALQTDDAVKRLAVSLHCIGGSSEDSIMPPVNWGNALNPILLNNSGSVETKVCAIKIVLSQCDRSSSCSSLLCKCTSVDVFNRLPVECRVSTCTSISKVFKAAKESDFITFLETMTHEFVCNYEKSLQPRLKLAFMQGLEDFIRNIENLPPSVHVTVERCLKRIFFESNFSICSDDLAIVRSMAACCRYLNISMVKTVDESTESHIMLKSLYFSCCCTLDSLHIPGFSLTTLLACGQQPDIHDEAVWITAMFTSEIKRSVKSSVLLEWLKGLMKLMERHHECYTSRNEIYVEYFVSLVVSILICLYFTTNCPVFDSFLGTHISESVVKSYHDLWRQSFASTVHKIMGKCRADGLDEAVVNWLKQMIERFQEFNSSSKWLDTLMTAIGVFKDIEAHMLPSLWCEMVSTLYPDSSQKS